MAKNKPAKGHDWCVMAGIVVNLLNRIGFFLYKVRLG